MSTTKKIVYGLFMILLGFYLVVSTSSLLAHLVSYTGTAGIIVAPLSALLIVLGYSWIVVKYVRAFNRITENPKK